MFACGLRELRLRRRLPARLRRAARGGLAVRRLPPARAVRRLRATARRGPRPVPGGLPPAGLGGRLDPLAARRRPRPPAGRALDGRLRVVRPLAARLGSTVSSWRGCGWRAPPSTCASSARPRASSWPAHRWTARSRSCGSGRRPGRRRLLPVELDPEIDRLYGIPLDEFVHDRDELAKRLRRDGEREAAEQVKKLRKPSAGAWALNQAVRRRRKETDALLAAGERLRAAHESLMSGGDQAELREAMREERELASGLADCAEAIASETGKSGPALRERVRSTLHAAAVDEEAREELAKGRFVREREAVGLGPFGAAPAVPAQRPSEAGPRAGEGPPKAVARRPAKAPRPADARKARFGEVRRPRAPRSAPPPSARRPPSGSGRSGSPRPSGPSRRPRRRSRRRRPRTARLRASSRRRGRPSASPRTPSARHARSPASAGARPASSSASWSGSAPRSADRRGLRNRARSGLERGRDGQTCLTVTGPGSASHPAGCQSSTRGTSTVALVGSAATADLCQVNQPTEVWRDECSCARPTGELSPHPSPQGLRPRRGARNRAAAAGPLPPRRRPRRARGAGRALPAARPRPRPSLHATPTSRSTTCSRSRASA